jgi:glycosyltransferase involved in cell wall biosynthesis
MSKIRLAIVTPVLNDWASASALLDHLHSSVVDAGRVESLEIFFIDDGSTDLMPNGFKVSSRGLATRVLRLEANVGHQRAILSGLRALEAKNYSHVAIMDSDGEDTPEGLSQLLKVAESLGDSIIVAQRGLRSESMTFRFFYWLHKNVFRLLVGKSLDFGNFALFPSSYLPSIATSTEISGHFASAVLSSGLPIVRIKINRGTRYFGSSKMNFEKLFAHSFASLAVFSGQIMVRLMILCLGAAIAAFLGIGMVVITRLLVESVTPGWATVSVGILALLSVQMLSFVALGTLISLNLASLKNFLLNQNRESVAREL